MTEPTRTARRTALATILLAALGVATAPFAGALQEAADALVPGQIEDPREVLERYPPLTVEPRRPALEESGYFPCTDCHDNEYQLSNPRVRVLEEMHDDVELEHGGGRFWCLTCHHDADRDSLTSLEGGRISFDESFLLCGQCHFQRQRDFFYGAHGKRLGSWRGERLVAPCTACHDAHRPSIPAAVPYPPPPVRRGLAPSPGHPHAAPNRWEQVAPASTEQGTEEEEPE